MDLRGLKGLPGLNRISDQERRNFYDVNKDILNYQNFHRQRDMDNAAEMLFNNRQFVDRYGLDVFNKYQFRD